MKEKVVNKVQKLRNEKGSTQEELAEAVGVTRQTIITLEKEECIPSVALAIKIAKYFKTPVEKIFKVVNVKTA